jgi:NAD(P)-dependent dehydrogenase (short-subunit alcohol dehydrogenase family)
LGQDGFGLTVSARRPDKLEQAAAQLRDEGLDVLSVAANMADEGDIKRMLGAHEERYGRIDVLMNNAGVGIGGAIAEAETKKLDMQIDVNLRAVYLATRDAIPMLKAAGADGGAMIVNTASIAGKRPQGWLAAYSATKAGVIALTEATSKELAGDGVRCTAICPGFVDTPMTEWARGDVPPSEMIRPEDVAEIVRCLLRLSPACIVPEVMMVRPAELSGP